MDNFFDTFEIPCINIFCNFVQLVHTKHKKRCPICCERESKDFARCSSCKKNVCLECYGKVVSPNCAFCRYDLKQHMFKRAKELNVEELI